MQPSGPLERPLPHSRGLGVPAGTQRVDSLQGSTALQASGKLGLRFSKLLPSVLTRLQPTVQMIPGPLWTKHIDKSLSKSPQKGRQTSKFSPRKTKSGALRLTLKFLASLRMHAKCIHPIEHRAEEAQRHSLIGGIEPLSALAKGELLVQDSSYQVAQHCNGTARSSHHCTCLAQAQSTNDDDQVV